MKAIASLIASLVVVTACSGSTTGVGTSSSGSTPDNGVKQGTETAPDPSTPPGTPQPTGKACGSASDCGYYFCKCNDGAIVNSRMCSQGTCQGPSAHCTSACTGFGHGGWSGTFGGGDTPAPPTGTVDAGTKDRPAGSCTSKEECAPFQCGCTNGSRIQVRDCYAGVCQDTFSGCQSACEDSGRGDWDGT